MGSWGGEDMATAMKCAGGGGRHGDRSVSYR